MLNKDDLLKRLAVIDQALNEGKKQIDNMIINMNVLEGQHREILYLISQYENAEKEAVVKQVQLEEAVDASLEAQVSEQQSG